MQRWMLSLRWKLLMGCAPTSQALQIQDREKEQEQEEVVVEQILKDICA